MVNLANLVRCEEEQGLVRECLEKGRLGPVDLRFFEADLSGLDDPIPERAAELCHGFRLRILVADRPGQNGGRPQLVDLRIALVRPVGRDPVDPVGLLVEAVVAALVRDVERDENARGDPDGQSQDVDEGIALMFEQVPGCDLEVIYEHGSSRRRLVYNMLTSFGAKRFPFSGISP